MDIDSRMQDLYVRLKAIVSEQPALEDTEHAALWELLSICANGFSGFKLYSELWDRFISNPSYEAVRDSIASRMKRILDTLDKSVLGAQARSSVKGHANPMSKEVLQVEKAPHQQGEPIKGSGTPSIDNDMKAVPLELRLLARFRKLNGQHLDHARVLPLLRTLQKAIATLQIRRTSKWASDIMQMQDDLIMLLHCQQGIVVEFDPARLARLSEILVEVDDSQVAKLLREYSALVGKHNFNTARNLLNKMIDLPSEGPRADEIARAKERLHEFVLGKSGSVRPSNMGLYGMDAIPATALAAMRFRKLTLSPRFSDFLGRVEDPCKMLIHGQPGSGKSTLAVDLASDIALQNDTRALIVSAEEGVGYKAQQRAKSHLPSATRMYFSARVPDNLDMYGVVVIDSVSALSATPDQLRNLYNRNPRTSFILVAQSTKQGKPRGSLEMEHDVDVVIQCDRMQATIAKNRYGGYTSMPIAGVELG